MNVALNSTQTNTKPGPIDALAGVDLTGLEGRLAKLGSADGKRQALLPTALTDAAVYVIAHGGPVGAHVTLESFTTDDSNFRCRAKGGGTAGTLLSLADPATAGDAGKLRAVPGTAGTFHALAIAEEDFQDGQHVLCRHFLRTVVNP